MKKVTSARAFGFIILAVSCGGAAVPALSSPTAPSALVAPTAAPTVASTPAPTAVPTAAITPTPVPTPSVFTISGTVTYADTGQPPSRTATNAYAVTGDFCQVWNAAANGAGQFPAAIFGGSTPPSYVIPNVPPGTYVIVTSPREAPGGNWFWRSGSPPTLSCDQATRVALVTNLVAEFRIPR